MADAIYLMAIIIIAVVFLIYGVKIALIMEDVVETIAYLVTGPHKNESIEEDKEKSA